MADEAAKALLRAAAPGHFDSVAEILQKFVGTTQTGLIKDIKEEQKKFQCIGIDKSPASHPLAQPLQQRLKQYQKDNFDGKVGVTARIAMESQSSSDLTVYTYAEKMDTPNKVSGYWKATWKIIGNTDAGECEMSGQVQIHSYAFEEGNAQLKMEKELSTTKVTKVALTTGETPTVLDGIMKQIMNWELEVLEILASMNETGTAEHLRAIRRVLPITKTKMKWEVSAQRSVKTLRKTAPDAKNKVTYGS